MSELRANTISAANGTDPVTLTKQSAAKAWVNFAGAGTSINDSQSMSSLSDDSTGKFTLTMSSAMGNTNYSVSQGIQEIGTANDHATVVRSDVTITSSVFGVATYSSSSYQDVTLCYASIHGDLA